ncbi:MAG: YggS family pyridoxal phosphate-dependent enzyme [Verrucomicrobiales bacterium]
MSDPRADHWRKIDSRLTRACEKAGRERAEVTLLAVSKTWPVEAIRPVVEAGQVDLGESRFQEAEGKIAELPSSLRWHFIGHLQRNKVRKVLPLFPVIHSISSLKLARYTDRIAGELGLRPQVYLEVNIGAEESKSGFFADELRMAMDDLVALPNLKIAGLMCLPPQGEGAETARPWFRQVRELKDELRGLSDLPLPGLSMGMSGDFEVAVEEGATIVRVGTAIFGQR